MSNRYHLAAVVGVVAMVCATAVQAQQQKGDVRTAKPINQSDLPEHMRPEAKIVKGYAPPRITATALIKRKFRSLQAWRRPTLPCLKTEYHRR